MGKQTDAFKSNSAARPLGSVSGTDRPGCVCKQAVKKAKRLCKLTTSQQRGLFWRKNPGKGSMGREMVSLVQ